MEVRRIGCQDGLCVAARIWGELGRPGSTPVLGLPGLSRNGADFRGLAERLTPRPFVALDFVGRGLADWAEDPGRYAPMATLDDIRHVTATLGLHRIVAAGTSFGGLLAMALAVSQPTLLTGAIINDVGPDAAESGADVWLDIVGDPPWPEGWDQAVAYLKDLVPNMSFEDEADWREFAETTFQARSDGKPGLEPLWDPRIVEPLRKADEMPDLWGLFRAAAVHPLAVVRGAETNVLMAETLERMQRTAPHIAAVIVPGVGHAPTLTEPPAFEAIKALLSEIDRAGVKSTTVPADTAGGQRLSMR
ncbi:MAG TPA: alpha/beta hydrolase [Alphaproteobacteria bacterium]|nr:alpha/beta hydrolase [Alphaproteobacteria bacterium]